MSDSAYTTLSGDKVQVHMENGALMVNDAIVTEADILASNGVVHKIDSVLLPPGTRVKFISQEVTSVADAYVRVIHLASDTPAVDVYVNGELAVRGVNYGRASLWLPVDEGTVEVAITQASNSVEEAYAVAEIEIARHAWTNVSLVGSDEQDTLQAAITPEAVEGDIPSGFATAVFFNGITAPPADFGPVIDLYADGQLLVETLRYPGVRGADGAYERNLPQGDYDFACTLQASPGVVLASLPDVPVTAGRSYFIAFAGVADDAYAFVLETVYGE